MTSKKQGKRADLTRSKRWGKRAEKIVAMTRAQLHAAAEKIDPEPTKPMSKKSMAAAAGEAFARGLTPDEAVKRRLIPDGALKTRILEHKAAKDWLLNTAKGSGPNARHARLIAQEMRKAQKELEQWILFEEVFWRVRRIDLASMMVLIVGP